MHTWGGVGGGAWRWTATRGTSAARAGWVLIHTAAWANTHAYVGWGGWRRVALDSDAWDFGGKGRVGANSHSSLG